jgi:hypothetical protein
VTVTLNAHGVKTGDRIEVATAAGAESTMGRFTVTSVTANSFTYNADGEDTVAAASALKFKRMYDVEAKTFSGQAAPRPSSTQPRCRARPRGRKWV